LHNAGNDAVYTMWILLATCVREAAERGKKETTEERKARTDAEITKQVESAKQKVME